MASKGYTLIEILVAVGIFTVVIAAPTGFFVGSLKAQQKSLSSQALLDNVSYTLEYLSRALRMAKKDTVGDCVLPAGAGNFMNYEKTVSRTLAGIVYSGPGIKFKNYQNPSVCQEIFLDESDKLLKESRNGGAPLPLTSKDLEVISFQIGSDDSWDQIDNEQPRITIFLEVKGIKSSMPELQPQLQIQTTISQRNLDVTY